MSRITVREARLDEQERILRIALTEPHAPQDHARKVCQLTQGYLQRCGGAIGGLHLAESVGQVLGACAAMDLPGAVSLLMVPGWSLTQLPPPVLADLLAAATAAVQQRGKRFAQLLFEPELKTRIQDQLLGTGFSFLAKLQYMQRNAFDPAAIQPVEGVAWRTLSQTNEQTFGQVIQRTYIDSRDCPRLAGIRSMQEVLAGHKGAGEFEPDGWYLLQHHGHDVGVMLTARTPMRASLEIVYCGLVPEARGKKLGKICVHKAIARARDLSIPAITLAVDAANEPALRTYEGMGFAAYASRDVWIKVFRRADSEGTFEWPKY